MRSKPDPSIDPPSVDVSNVVLALAALERLGGAERYIDIEAVTLEAYRMAPDRFSWRTRRDYPSWERVRTAFVHANQQEQKRAGGSLVVSNTDGSAWKLTAEGVAFVRNHTARIAGPIAKGGPPRRTGRLVERVRGIRRHRAFRNFVNGTAVADIPRYELAELLLCPPDSPREAVRRKLDAAKAAAVNVGDDEVRRFLEEVQKEVGRKWS